MSLATLERTNGSNLATRRQAAEPSALSISDIWDMAQRVAASKMFGGIDTPDKAFVLMMICESEGLHPMQAVRRFDVIQGRPAMKAAAMAAEFQARGGVIEILETTSTVARARFSHPTKQPTPIEMSARIEEFRHLSGKDNYKLYPADMLWARLTSRGVRRVDPGIVVGIGSVEEVWETTEREEAAYRRPQLEPASHAGPLPPRGGDVPVPGGPTSGMDSRPFLDVIKAASEAIGKPDTDILSHLRNAGVQQGLITGEPPTKRPKIIETLSKLYGIQRDWIREQIASLAPEQPAPVESALPPQATATYSEDDPNAYDPDANATPAEAQADLWPAGRE